MKAIVQRAYGSSDVLFQVSTKDVDKGELQAKKDERPKTLSRRK